ncbi:MAG: metallopeptidase family protein [Chloroflexi bacterium]|nr:metallopeptidase family protein [Chloroflexota bacterium]
MSKPDRTKSISLSRRRFECLVRKALATLPEEFQNRLENVAVVIEDEPPGHMPDIMGLYEGVPAIERTSGGADLPDLITLYQVPIECVCRTEEDIEAEVRLTVLHEVGHYFGLDEAQLE